MTDIRDNVEALKAAHKAEADSLRERVAELQLDHDHLSGKYYELIYQVSRKYPGETRHETALRYLREAERSHDATGNAGVAEQQETNITIPVSKWRTNEPENE